MNLNSYYFKTNTLPANNVSFPLICRIEECKVTKKMRIKQNF